MIIGIDHVQITVPADAVADARAFYCPLLGLREVEKPAALRGGGILVSGRRPPSACRRRGGRRSARDQGARRVCRHRRDGVAVTLVAARVEVIDTIAIPGYERLEFRDLFGNRVEIIGAAKYPA